MRFITLLLVLLILVNCTTQTSKQVIPSKNDSVYNDNKERFLAMEIDTTITRDIEKFPEDTTVYPKPIDWNESFVSLRKAEIQLQEWIQHHPDYNRGRDLMRDHIHRPLITLLKVHPETMKYDFPVLKDKEHYFHSVTSKDGRLRVYSWNTGTGGTWRRFDGLCQYSYNGEVKSVYGGINHLLEGKEKYFPDDDPWDNDVQWVYKIYDLQTSDGSTYYLIFSDRQFSTIAYADYVELCTITSKGVKRVEGFKSGKSTKNMLVTNIETILTDSNMVDCIYHPEYKEDHQILRIPVSTDGRIVSVDSYKFNGAFFLRILNN